MTGESTEILSNYFTQAKIKTTCTQFARTTACQVLTIFSNSLHSKASYINHKENFLHHKELNLGCSVTIRNGAKSCICFVAYGSQVFQNCYISLFVNDCEMSGTKN